MDIAAKDREAKKAVLSERLPLSPFPFLDEVYNNSLLISLLKHCAASCAVPLGLFLPNMSCYDMNYVLA